MRERWSLPGFMLEEQERQYVRRESRNVLATYVSVRAENPALTGKVLYEEVVTTWTGGSTEAARALVRVAEQSFAVWPSERELTFRDVVHALCFERLSKMHDNRKWTYTLLRPVVDSEIPRDL